MEAHALALCVRWRGRQRRTHHHRLLVLADAQAMSACATKGRSSTLALGGALQAYAAGRLAADYWPRIISVPSESKPANEPSRGRHRASHRTNLRCDAAPNQCCRSRERVGPRVCTQAGHMCSKPGVGSPFSKFCRHLIIILPGLPSDETEHLLNSKS